MCLQTGVRFPEETTDDVQKQKQLLKDAASFLLSCQIPSLVSLPLSSDLLHTCVCVMVLSVSVFLGLMQVKDCLDHSALPMDGATFAETLHQRGINIRYLGTVLEFLDKTSAKAQLEHIYVRLTHKI